MIHGYVSVINFLLLLLLIIIIIINVRGRSKSSNTTSGIPSTGSYYIPLKRWHMDRYTVSGSNRNA